MTNFSVECVLSRQFEPVEHHYSRRDTALYALGVGLGESPTDPRQLRFVYEQRMLALPTMAVVLATPGFWLQDESLGIIWENVLHGEQGFELHDILPVEGAVIGTTRVNDILDRGAEKGAFIYSTNELREASTGRKIATLTSTDVCRSNGGFGGRADGAPPPHPIPTRAADAVWDFKTDAKAALIYRLSGDYNPLHVDPAVASVAGFESPILHGLCTFGIAGHALLRETCEYDPSRLTAMKVRFSAPVYPGDTIRTEMWRDGSTVSFRSSVRERGVVVLNNGKATVERSLST
ncbi:MaoC family dehydratase [Allomesorhizobium camelthorni]|uniref:3-alpha,7-alpha, 12-alpha-trihydroxy-5-beta-cholest-24-enoyl-CoA hydratase n=1 Tax=Allomesorhizobium camelthorni TaxID=475069 RepID=A0A6G4WJ97_9HYPH|nr:MaoC family dehydratase [Mesorhizobium camelthorni]NGO54679.1 3-alpha,7-alpha,12-alpha-trihydroxy-5-beta-cholest-24-enoyl-CoA hydratase [Mesorhizobium camelthorni]